VKTAVAKPCQGHRDRDPMVAVTLRFRILIGTHIVLNLWEVRDQVRTPQQTQGAAEKLPRKIAEHHCRLAAPRMMLVPLVTTALNFSSRASCHLASPEEFEPHVQQELACSASPRRKEKVCTLCPVSESFSVAKENKCFAFFVGAWLQKCSSCSAARRGLT
jgi:hypothetical protein